MNENELLIKNRLREATVILERANLIICDESWKCDSSRPPFSSFQLVMQGEGTVQVDQTVLHPHAGQLYLLPACTHQSFFTDVQNPYRTYFCHFEITCQQTDLFQLVQFPLCVDAKDPQKAQRIFQDIIQSCKQTDISSALKAKQAVFHLLCYYFECCPPGSLSFHNPLTLHFPVQFPMLKHICMSRLPYNRWQKWPAIIPVTLQNYFKPTWEFLLDSLFCRKKRKLQRCF